MAKEPQTVVQSELSSIEKQYERKVFWTRAVPVLRNAGLFIWSAVDLILVFGALVFLVWYLVQGVFVERQLVARIGQNYLDQRSLAVSQQASGLVVSSVQVFSGADGRFDLYATAGNPNEKWFATFTYYFETSVGDTEKREGYVLPGDEQIILALSNEWSNRPGRAELKLENIEWRRVKDIPDADIVTWLGEHDDFAISNITHGAVTKVGDRDVVQTGFTITNNSPYSYWDTDIVVLLKVGNNVVGVNQIRIPSLDSAETQSKTLSWFWSPSAGATPHIFPQINFFDPEIYKDNPSKPTGELIERL